MLHASRFAVIGVLLAALVWAFGVSPCFASPFGITLNFTGGLTTDEQALFTQAADYWQSVITGYNPDYTHGSVNGLTINASATNMDGARGVLAATSVTASGTRIDDVAESVFYYNKTASVTFDLADVPTMMGTDNHVYFYDVVLHEMAHAIGFGMKWTKNGVYAEYQSTGQYTGAAALAAYRTEFNQPGATFVPVETAGGGTADCHWAETLGGAGPTGIVDSHGRDMKYELMTPWVNYPCFISQTTIASFADIGYTVVPEPGTLALLAVAVVALSWFRRGRWR